MLLIEISEHQKLEQKENFCPPDENFKLLDKNFQASYFIGLDWLDEKNALFVKPKIENLDFLKMFVECLKNVPVEINKKRRDKEIYKIHTNKKSIQITQDNFEITPFIIIHFIQVLERICKRGLMKNYIRKEENLSSKIKGKILFSNNFKKKYGRWSCR